MNYKIFADILKDIENLKEQIESHSTKITRLDQLALRGTWCAYRDGNDKITGVGIPYYDRLTISDTNLDINWAPLNIRTGKKTVLL